MWIIKSWLWAIALITAKQALVMLGVTSGVKVLPPPGVSFHWYTFLYDWSHQFFNITNTRLSPQPIDTPPGNKEVPK